MQLNTDKAVAVCVQYFLRTLMRLEREKYGWSVKEASRKARWDMDVWRQLETHAIPIEPHHWINISAVFELNEERLVRRLNDFIQKNPVLLVSGNEQGQMNIFDKAITSPRLIQNQNIFTFNLAPSRSKLFDILSLYTPEGDALLAEAKQRGVYEDGSALPLKPSFKLQNTNEKREIRKSRLARFVAEKVEDDKLDALETALMLVATKDTADVNRAVEIMSIILK